MVSASSALFHLHFQLAAAAAVCLFVVFYGTRRQIFLKRRNKYFFLGVSFRHLHEEVTRLGDEKLESTWVGACGTAVESLFPSSLLLLLLLLHDFPFLLLFHRFVSQFAPKSFTFPPIHGS